MTIAFTASGLVPEKCCCNEVVLRTAFPALDLLWRRMMCWLTSTDIVGRDQAGVSDRST